MTTVQFYHLISTSRERAMARLMEKALTSGARVVILCEDDAAIRRMSDALWTDNPDGFIPHDVATSPHAANNPIILCTEATNPNNATIMCILNGTVPPNAAQFAKLLDVFDGSREDAVIAARERWSHYKSLGFSLQYVKQQPGGGWNVEAKAA